MEVENQGKSIISVDVNGKIFCGNLKGVFDLCRKKLRES